MFLQASECRFFFHVFENYLNCHNFWLELFVFGRLFIGFAVVLGVFLVQILCHFYLSHSISKKVLIQSFRFDCPLKPIFESIILHKFSFIVEDKNRWLNANKWLNINFMWMQASMSLPAVMLNICPKQNWINCMFERHKAKIIAFLNPNGRKWLK